jgi:predicted dienelactone hydrolase
MKTITTLILTLTTSIFLAQHAVGHYQVTFQDPDRNNRDIQTEIYYPATTAGDNTPVASGQFPVIVFGHGFVMAWDAYENLWEEFVPRGYIMVFPRTEGNAFSTDHQEFGWDLQFLVTELQAEGLNASAPIFNAVHNNTAIMGHSMGGGASFLAADSLCANGNTQLKTLVGLAPAESTSNGVSSITSATQVTVPAVILSGSQDGVTPPVDHHIPMYDNLASTCKTFVSVTGGAHCYFANSNFNCDFGEGTSSSGISIDRAEQHAITFDFLNNWLDYTLKEDCDAFALFQDSVALSGRVTTNQTCTTNPVSTVSESAGILSSSVSGTGYQWYLDGTPINGANNIDFTPTASGNYSVEVVFSSGCSTISLPYTFTPNTSGITEGQQSFDLYPNPTTGLINFNATIDQVEVFNIDGVCVLMKQNIKTIDLSTLASGVYLIHINGLDCRKVIKK